MTFKLPDFLSNGLLNTLRSNMGAPLTSTVMTEAQIKPIELPDVTRLREEGIDIESWDDLQVLSDGTFAYKNKRVLLYIRDFENAHGLPKFHTALCATLEKMKTANRWGRYVIANREDGLFAVSINRSTTLKNERLDVCKNCLHHIQWQGYHHHLASRKKYQLHLEFTLPDFFKTYPRDLIVDKPKHTSDSAPLNDYLSDWSAISSRTRHAKNYCCEACGIQLKNADAKYLHVHHKNGQRNENHPGNLEVLCICCHAEKPLHGHMKTTPDYLAFLK